MMKMTIEEFKDVYGDKSPAEKLQLLATQYEILCSDVVSRNDERWSRNTEYWDNEIRVMRARIEWLMREILGALTPHVLTLEEACGAEECWLERKNNPVTAADVAFNDRDDGWDVDTRELNTLREYAMSSAYYGIFWRCWSARPTDAQREAEEWQIL